MDIARKFKVDGVFIGNDNVIAEKTYAQLLALANAGTMIPGQMYRITDYVTTTTQTKTSSAGHAFDLIVTAISGSEIDEAHVVAIQHAGDTYFADNDLAAWEVHYCLQNDTDRFAWADDENGKGVIYRLVDEFGNDCPYDFKNILFERTLCTEIEEIELENLDGDTNTWETRLQIVMANSDSKFVSNSQILGKGITGYTLTDASGRSQAEDWLYWRLDSSDDMYKYAASEIWVGESAQNTAMRVSPAFPIRFTVNGQTRSGYAFAALVKGNRTVDLFTFASSPSDDYEFESDYECEDRSLAGKDNEVYGNVMQMYNNGLNNNVFVGDYNYGNSFAVNCYNNSFGNDFYSNSFGNSCYYNSFGNDFYYNSFGNECYRNSFGNGCYSNSFGNGCQYNSFGNSCSDNSFGNECYYNSFGNYCRYNSFGNECYRNSFGNECYYNSFGNECYRNSFGNYCYSNSFGNECYRNSFGNSCSDNSFGNDFYYNSFGDECQKITVFEGVQYVEIEGEVQYAQVLNGTQGTSSALLTIGFSTGESYCQVAGKDSNGTLQVWCPADYA